MPEFPNTLSPEMAALLEAVAAETGPPVDTTLMPVAEGRALTEKLAQRWNTDLPDMAASRTIMIPADHSLGSAPCRTRLFVPHKARSGALVFAHGGGFVFCSPETHERFARILAAETRLPVFVPDYRLAPEHPFPAGLKDVVACMRGVFRGTAHLGVRAGPLLVAGDSAGANLALAAVLHEQREARAAPDGALLFYGVYDADLATPSYVRFAEGPGLTQGRMLRFWDHYLADKNARKNPLTAPLHASDAELRALPPLHLMAAGVDPLLSDSIHFAARLQALGRQETLAIVPGVVHGFLQMSGFLGAARDALSAAAAAANGMIKT